MEKYSVDLKNGLGTIRYYKNKSNRPIPINIHSSRFLDLTYTDSLLAIF